MMKFNQLEIAIANAAALSMKDQDTFREIRKNGFGASDSSVVLGVNPFPDNTESELIRQKNAKEPTETELKIGKMVNVRKGADLEELILKKFTEKWQIDLIKPAAMYRFSNYKYLTVNFDGVTIDEHHPVPVEAKFISSYGGKYYDFTKAVEPLEPLPPRPHSSETNFQMYCKDMATQSGIPVYYYTQIQQQMLALEADYAYLTTIFDKDWETRTWIIYKDDITQQEIIIRGYKLWQKIEMLRGAK